MNEKLKILSPTNEESHKEINFKKLFKRGNTLNLKKMKNYFIKKNSRYSVDIETVNPTKFILPKANSPPVDFCLYALNIMPKQRNIESLQYIISYLKSLPAFMNILSKEKNLKLSENLIEQISIHLRHEYIPRNNLVCRYGERGEKFYIILKGKVNFFIPKLYKCYLNFEEYLVYLMQLRKNNEFELINNLLLLNKAFYPFEDDNLDKFLIKEYQEYYKTQKYKKFIKSKSKHFKKNLNIIEEFNNEIVEKEFILNAKNINKDNTENNNNENNKGKKKKEFFSLSTYTKMEDLINIIYEKRKTFDENNYSGENTPNYYIKSNSVINSDLESKGRKLVNYYKYEEMNSFEQGQNFGFIALQSKSCKRSATAIVVKDSDLGVLNKEEYLEFFEMLSNKEKKNLYELLKFYNLLASVSEHKFIKKYYHMFEYIKYVKNSVIMDINIPINELIIFNSGLFVINIFVNIAELNELITTLKLIKGRILGLSKQKIELDLKEKNENENMIKNKNYISENDNKILNKRYNFTLSIISDHLIVGYPDTVDPITHKPLFNCTCLSAESEGYFISKRSIKLINQDSIVLQDLNQYCLMKIEYNLNRLQQFKNEIISKTKKNEISSSVSIDNKSSITENNKKKERSFSDNKGTNINIKANQTIYLNRNDIFKKKSRNNKKFFFSLKFNSNIIENTLNKYNMIKTKNKEIKINKEREKKKLMKQATINIKSRNRINDIKTNNNDMNKSKSYLVNNLTENILEKKKVNKLWNNFKDIKDIDNNCKQEEEIKLDKNYIPKNLKSLNNMETIFIEKRGRNTHENNNSSNSVIKHSFSQDFFINSLISKLESNKKCINKNKVKTESNILYTQFYTGNNYLTLPSINKMERNQLKAKMEKESNSDFNSISPTIKSLDYSNNNKETKNKNKDNEEKNRYISYDDFYKKTQTQISPSIIKQKYIIFKTPSIIAKKGMNILSFGINNKNKNNPVNLKKRKNTNLDILLNEEKKNNNNNINNFEDKNYDFFKSTFKMNEKIKKKNLDFFINEKYKELKYLVNNLHKTTEEILYNNNNK